jgi:PPOX class probable F420-dependent enzyme
MRLTKAVATFLQRERVCRAATADDDGMPHVVPVCHVFEKGRIYFGSGKKAGKIKNLDANPRVAVTVDLYTDAWSYLRGVMVQGPARIVRPGPEFRRLRKALYAKYPQYEREAALGDRDSVIVEVVPDHVFHWGFE